MCITICWLQAYTTGIQNLTHTNEVGEPGNTLPAHSAPHECAFLTLNLIHFFILHSWRAWLKMQLSLSHLLLSLLTFGARDLISFNTYHRYMHCRTCAKVYTHTNLCWAAWDQAAKYCQISIKWLAIGFLAAGYWWWADSYLMDANGCGNLGVTPSVHVCVSSVCAYTPPCVRF